MLMCQTTFLMGHCKCWTMERTKDWSMDWVDFNSNQQPLQDWPSLVQASIAATLQEGLFYVLFVVATVYPY